VITPSHTPATLARIAGEAQFNIRERARAVTVAPTLTKRIISPRSKSLATEFLQP
jgi:hypothetical protein